MDFGLRAQNFHAGDVQEFREVLGQDRGVSCGLDGHLEIEEIAVGRGFGHEMDDIIAAAARRRILRRAGRKWPGPRNPGRSPGPASVSSKETAARNGPGRDIFVGYCGITAAKYCGGKSLQRRL